MATGKKHKNRGPVLWTIHQSTAMEGTPINTRVKHPAHKQKLKEPENGK